MKKNTEIEQLEQSAKGIISLMKEDWELGTSPITFRSWIQKGGLGKGGITKNVSDQLMEYMSERKYILSNEEPHGYRKSYRLPD